MRTLETRRVSSGRAAVALRAAPALAAILAFACGAAKGSSFDDPNAGGGAGGGDPTFGAPGQDGGPSLGGSSGSGGGIADAACATETHKSQSSPVDIYILMDQSGSMADSSKWSNVVSALTSFMADPKSAGLGVGIQYFPLPGVVDQSCVAKCTDCACVEACGCSGCSCTNNVCSCPAGGSGDSCTTSDYGKPDVPIGALPGVASAVGASLAAHSPLGGTPTKAALSGGLAYAQSFMAAHSDHKVAIVLATDGDPNECSTDLLNAAGEVAQVASSGLNATPSIQTFVIGVGSEVTKLDQVAAAGGTQKAYLVDTGANATGQFEDALDKIKSSAIACEFSIPALASGQIDYGKVNVQYQSANGPVLVPQVGSKSACDPTKGGWYYDDPSKPAKIEICDASCGAFNQVSVAQVDVVYGCATEKAPPPK